MQDPTPEQWERAARYSARSSQRRRRTAKTARQRDTVRALLLLPVFAAIIYGVLEQFPS